MSGTITGKFDPVMGMYVVPPCPPDMNQLRFLRWLVEHQRFEHSTAGPSTGEFTWPKSEAN